MGTGLGCLRLPARVHYSSRRPGYREQVRLDKFSEIGGRNIERAFVARLDTHLWSSRWGKLLQSEAQTPPFSYGAWLRWDQSWGCVFWSYSFYSLSFLSCSSSQASTTATALSSPGLRRGG